MKTNSKLLVDALSVVNGAINNASTLPIIQNVLFELDGNALTLTCTDLENTLIVDIEVESDTTTSFCTDGKKLVEFLKAIGNEEITLNIGNVLEIVTSNGKYELPIEPTHEYPNAPDINGQSVEIPSDVLKEGFSKTIGFTSSDDLRPTITGVYLHSNVFCATDTYVLSKFTTNTHLDGEYIIPKKAVNLIRSIIQNDVTIVCDDKNMKLISGSITLIARLIDGKFPNYEAVIPKENPNLFTFNRKDLLSTLKRLSVFANKQTNQIKFTFSEHIIIESQDLDYNNRGREVFKGQYIGDNLVIGFNARFLTSILNNFTEDTLTLQMSEPNRAAVIESNGLLSLVMPVLCEK